MSKDNYYNELEKEATKWLNETDEMQFSTMELLTMFAEHWQAKLKNNGVLDDVSGCENQHCENGFVGELYGEKISCGMCDISYR